MKPMPLFLAAAILLCALLAGCGAATGGAASTAGSTPQDNASQDDTPLPEFVPADGQALFAEGAAAPVAVSRRQDGEAGGFEALVCDPDAVQQVLAGMANTRVGGLSSLGVSDRDTIYTFYLPDGARVSFTFEGGSLRQDGKCYTITQDEIPRDVWPEEGDFVYESCPDSALRDGFDRLQEGVPAHAERLDGCIVVPIDQPEELEALTENLLCLKLTWIDTAEQLERHLQERTPVRRVYTLTWEDGAQAVFTFEGNDLLASCPEPLGIWGYECDTRLLFGEEGGDEDEE